MCEGIGLTPLLHRLFCTEQCKTRQFGGLRPWCIRHIVDKFHIFPYPALIGIQLFKVVGGHTSLVGCGIRGYHPFVMFHSLTTVPLVQVCDCQQQLPLAPLGG